MNALERASLFLTLIRELQALLEREVVLLRAMDIEALRELQQDKAVLADAYETELRALHASPEFVAELDPGVREALFEAMRELRATMRENLNALLAAREVVERVTRHIAESLAGSEATRRLAALADGPAHVVPLALDRRV